MIFSLVRLWPKGSRLGLGSRDVLLYGSQGTHSLEYQPYTSHLFRLSVTHSQRYFTKILNSQHVASVPLTIFFAK